MVRPLGLVLAVASITGCSGVWPWDTDRFFADAGSSADDRTFAGARTSSTGSFRVQGITSCPCDLTANLCDASCCCDRECNSKDRNDIFDCDNAAVTTRANVTMCSDAIADVNAPVTVRAEADAEGNEAFSSVLCVEFDNSASYGVFVDPVDPLSKSEFDTRFAAAVRSSFSEQLERSVSEISSTRSSSNFYRAGQPLNRGTGKSDEFSADSWAPLTTTLASGLTTACDEEARVPFLQSMTPARCVTYFSTTRPLEDLCTAGTTLDGSVYESMRVGTSGSDPSESGYETIGVNVAAVHYVPFGGTER